MRATEVAGLVVYSTAALMLVVWLIWTSRPAERARGAAARGFPCSFRTGMLGALCEDATDKGGAFNYDRRALASLRFLTLDFTPGPEKDFRACPASLALVSASTQLGIHPDVSGTAVPVETELWVAQRTRLDVTCSQQADLFLHGPEECQRWVRQLFF